MNRNSALENATYVTGDESTRRRVRQLLAERDPDGGGRPIYIRPPRNICPYCSLRRTKFLELVVPSRANLWKAPVRSVVIKKPGAVRGVRLVHLQSLLEYLDRLFREQEADANRKSDQ